MFGKIHRSNKGESVVRQEAALWDKFSGFYDAFMKKDMPAYLKIAKDIKDLTVPGSRILEIATGTGIISLEIAAGVNEITALDISPDMIAKAKKKAEKREVRNIDFSVQDARFLPYDKETFDVVIIANALHVMPEPEKVLCEINRVIKKGGYLIAPTFIHAQNKKSAILSRLMSVTGFKAYHKWSLGSYCSFLEENGFEITRKSIIEASLPLGHIIAQPINDKDPAIAQKDKYWIYHDLIASIIAALDAKDHFTADHSLRVSNMVEKICGYLGLGESETETIHIAAHVHDIGKIGIPDKVLTKPGALNDEEKMQIQQHPIIGAKILKKSNVLLEIAEIVLHHHERWDGKGYPECLQGTQIPFGSRIIAVCDSIDAMLTDRHYRQAMTFKACKDEIKRNKGVMYDPFIAGTMLEKWDEIIADVYKKYE